MTSPGEICHQRGQLHVEWKVKDVSSLSEVVDTCRESHSFIFLDYSFYLRMYCNGESKYNSEGWIGLYLIAEDSCPAMNVQFTFGFKTTEGEIEHKFSDIGTFPEENSVLGKSRALERSQLRRVELTPSDILTITATLKLVPKLIEGLKEGSVGRIREIKSTSLCKELFWEIDDALDLLADMKGFAFSSSPFSFNAHEGSLLWDVREVFDDQNLLIYATMHCAISECLNWSMGVLGADGTKHNTQNWQAKASDCSKLTLCWNGPSRSELLKKKEVLLPGGVLTFFVQISTVDAADVSIQIADEDIGTIVKAGCQPSGGENVLEAIGKLWQSGENSDVVLQVGDVEFKAHRAILGVRTPVLAAMFQHDTIEKTTGVVTMSDCEPAIFEELLHCIYTGAPKELTTENAFALYAVANKYLVGELKAQCLRCIRVSLCVETFCDAVLLALNYGEAELLELAIEFATKNVRKIIRSVKWQRFVQVHPIKANEILIKALGPE